MQKTVAFYAPLKSPNDPNPSGDREIARLFMRALQRADFHVKLASEVKSYQKRPDLELYAMRKVEVEAECRRIGDLWQADPGQVPDLWFTYHPYCKSPDWLGPPLCKEFRVPYVTAEACRTGQNTDKDWQLGRHAVQEAIRMADLNLVLKDNDWIYLETLMPDMKTAYRIHPFLDTSRQPEPRTDCETMFTNRDPVIMTAGMMRPGKKLECYVSLAATMRKLTDLDWNLLVAGDGPEMGTVRDMLSFVPQERIQFSGAVEHNRVFALMDASDIFFWPGIREPIGMVYLEAQSRGLPVVALNNAGVPSVVGNGTSGLLAHDADSMAAGLRQLIANAGLRQTMGQAGRHRIAERHDVGSAARTLVQAIGALLA